MKGIIIGLMVLLLISCLSFAIAEDNISEFASEDLSNISEGTLISPQPATGTVDQATQTDINDELNESVTAGTVFRERVKLWLTFNQEKKAEQELKLAKLELVRAKIAAKNNNSVAMEKALEAHNRIINRVKERVNSMYGKTTGQGVRESAAKLVGLERAIEVHEARIAKFEEILSAENLSDDQMIRVQAKIEQAKTNTANLKEVEEAKKEKLKTRLMAVANMTEEQAHDEIEKLEDARNLSAVKKLVAEVKAVRAEKASEAISKVIKKLEEKQAETGKDAGNAIGKLRAIHQKIERKSGSFED